MHLLMALLNIGCLVNTELYLERRAELTDDDGDGFHEDDGDCDDTDASVHPGAEEVCNGFDNDCNGTIDDGAVDVLQWHPDEDNDGYGDTAQYVLSCTDPGGWLNNGDDCDDSNPDVNPDGIEVCNSIDDDCNGAVDDDVTDASVWYTDKDGDGYGDSDDFTEACLRPAGSVSLDGDCNDKDAAIAPDADEVCLDGVDNNCNGNNDECSWETVIDLTEQITISGVSDEELFACGGYLGDLDGDGTDELLIGALFSENAAGDEVGAVFSYELPLSGHNLTADDADRTLYGETLEGVGWVVVAEDIDGDGYDDLISTPYGAVVNGLEYSGHGYVHYGPLPRKEAADISLSASSADWELWGYAFDELSRQTFPIGDLDGDGDTDFAMGSAYSNPGGITDAGLMYIYTTEESGAEWADESAIASIGGIRNSDAFGITMTGGDVDGDGQTELLGGAQAAAYGDGEVYLFEYESLSGVMDTRDADESWLGEENAITGRAIEVADFNNDGTPDMAISGEGSQNGTAYLVWGGAGLTGGFLGDADVRIRGTDTKTPGSKFAYRLHTDDFNGDGFADLVVSEGKFNPADFFVFYGPFGEASLLYDTDADVKLISNHELEDQDYPTIFSGDATGDGATDLFIGSLENNDNKGLMYIVPGIAW